MKRLLCCVTAVFICVLLAFGENIDLDRPFWRVSEKPLTGEFETPAAESEIPLTKPKKRTTRFSSPKVKAGRWVTAWMAAPDSPGPALKTQTIRQIVRTGIGGSKVRIRLSNLFGTTPLTIGPVHLAKHERGSVIKSGTDLILTFGGKTTATVPKGAEIVSDPVNFPVAALEQLAVSLYLPNGAETSTIHSTAIQTAFITPRDATGETDFPKGETDTSRYFLTDLEVVSQTAAQTIVIVGDSITDGVGSTEDGNTRYPDALAERLQADPARASIAVANAGISGNRILNDGAEPYLGPSVLKRFERDALSKPGVRWILLLSGGNDISAAHLLGTPEAKVSVEQIIDGMKTLIKRARQKGVKIFGATLTPKEGSEFYYPEGEKKRQQVNTWIRTSGEFDAVVDFDKLLRDPARPERLLATFDSGDHIHPNDAGFKAMAAGIDLDLFTRKK
jgi:lysophospholipase L1-like esterase